MVESEISIFVSYRREDSRHVAGRLADRLQDHFRLFMDTDTIEPGVDFGRVVRREIGNCDVLLAVIGTRWTSVVDDQGRRRLEDPNDWVVEEIRTALLRDIRVIPVLVDGAEMPQLADLPSSLAPLRSRQALALRHESFSADVNWLVTTIQRMAKNQALTSQQRATTPAPVDQAGMGAAPTDQNAPAEGVRVSGPAGIVRRLLLLGHGKSAAGMVARIVYYACLAFTIFVMAGIYSDIRQVRRNGPSSADLTVASGAGLFAFGLLPTVLLAVLVVSIDRRTVRRRLIGSARPESPRPTGPAHSPGVAAKVLVILGILVGLVILIILVIVALMLTS